MKIAVFASGFGSNLEALIEAVRQETLQAEIELLVTDQPGCFAVERARKYNIDVFAFNAKVFSSKEEYEKKIVKELADKGIELIVLAGYMRIIGSTLLESFKGRIINIHPSLLPAFPGLHAIEKAYKYGVKVFGITIHHVDEGVDTGKIIAQDSFKIAGTESLEEVETLVHHLEHRLYPATIQKIIEEYTP